MSALITDELSLVNALRARKDELNVTCEEIDQIGGLPPGWTSKVLGWPPIKRFGLHSFWIVASALGLGIQLAVNPHAEQRFSTRMEIRDIRWVRKHAIVSSKRIPWLINANSAREMATLRIAKIPAWKRRAIARKAGRASAKARRAAARAAMAAHADKSAIPVRCR